MVVSRLRSIWTVPDLRNKVLFTLGMLLIFRIVAYIPVPGIDASQISKALNSNTNTGLNQIFGLLDVFTGGSLQNFSIVAMGVYPYITASIVVQLLQNIKGDFRPRLGCADMHQARFRFLRSNLAIPALGTMLASPTIGRHLMPFKSYLITESCPPFRQSMSNCSGGAMRRRSVLRLLAGRLSFGQALIF